MSLSEEEVVLHGLLSYASSQIVHLKLIEVKEVLDERYYPKDKLKQAVQEIISFLEIDRDRLYGMPAIEGKISIEKVNIIIKDWKEELIDKIKEEFGDKLI